MKNQALKERKNLKQLEKENFKYIKTEVRPYFDLCFLNNIRKNGKNKQKASCNE